MQCNGIRGAYLIEPRRWLALTNAYPCYAKRSNIFSRRALIPRGIWRKTMPRASAKWEPSEKNHEANDGDASHWPVSRCCRGPGNAQLVACCRGHTGKTND